MQSRMTDIYIYIHRVPHRKNTNLAASLAQVAGLFGGSASITFDLFLMFLNGGNDMFIIIFKSASVDLSRTNQVVSARYRQRSTIGIDRLQKKT